MDQAELAAHFSVAEDASAKLRHALEQAGWPYHEDATGRLWSVFQAPGQTSNLSGKFCKEYPEGE